MPRSLPAHRYGQRQHRHGSSLGSPDPNHACRAQGHESDGDGGAAWEPSVRRQTLYLTDATRLPPSRVEVRPLHWSCGNGSQCLPTSVSFGALSEVHVVGVLFDVSNVLGVNLLHDNG